MYDLRDRCWGRMSDLISTLLDVDLANGRHGKASAADRA